MTDGFTTQKKFKVAVCLWQMEKKVSIVFGDRWWKKF